MIIVSLKRKNGNVEIVFDDGNVIVVDYDVVIKSGIRRSDNLNEDEIKYLINRSEINKIKKYAFRFLGIRNHSSYEIKLKLLKKKFPQDLVNEAVNELIEGNILNDFKFAEQFLEEKSAKSKFGPNKIRNDLIKKGINRKILDELFSKIDEKHSFDVALALAEKKQKTIKEKDRKKSKQKIFFYLQSKGFDIDVIYNVLNKLNIGYDE